MGRGWAPPRIQLSRWSIAPSRLEGRLDNAAHAELAAPDRKWPLVGLEFISAPTAPERLRALTLGFSDARRRPSDYVFDSILAACARANGERILKEAAESVKLQGWEAERLGLGRRRRPFVALPWGIEPQFSP